PARLRPDKRRRRRMEAGARKRIAVFSGPTATIQNTVPLVTSNKARAKYGLPPRLSPDGSPPRFDHLRPQRLAAPITVYVRQVSPARARRRRAVRPAGRVPGRRRRDAARAAERPRRARVRGDAPPGRRPLPPALHGQAGRRLGLGRRYAAPGRPGPADAPVVL